MTMSAASDDAVAPRAPIATPTSATARAGASLMPSPTMTSGPAASSRSCWTASTLSVGDRSASTASIPTAAPTISGTRVVVARHHDDPGKARPTQASDGARRLRSDRVVQDQRPAPRHRLARTHSSRRPAWSDAQLAGPGRQAGAAANEPGRPDGDVATVDEALDAGTGRLGHLGRDGQCQAPLAGGAHDGGRQHVR